ncbi:MAG: hypothetical protein OEL91_05690 [Burkholderiaceae bacterium]|nr:hypothetical protein [Burkholderiaceae bacterium]
MRWKLLRRRLSISAPRMIVRRHLPWPLRWAAFALMLGFSAAIAMKAFEVGKSIAGLDTDAKNELANLRVEVAQLREEREKALSIANTAESQIKTEIAAQEKLAQQVRQVELENMSLKADLGFFERLLPAGRAEGLTIRGLQAETREPGQLRFQLLVMQSGKTRPEFHGRYELTLGGTLEGKAWTYKAPDSPRSLQLKQYLRVEGLVDYPVQAVVKTVRVRVTDGNGRVLATQSVKL